MFYVKPNTPPVFHHHASAKQTIPQSSLHPHLGEVDREAGLAVGKLVYIVPASSSSQHLFTCNSAGCLRAADHGVKTDRPRPPDRAAGTPHAIGSQGRQLP